MREPRHCDTLKQVLESRAIVTNRPVATPAFWWYSDIYIMVSVLIPTITPQHFPYLITGLMKEIYHVGGELIVANNGGAHQTNTLLSKYDCTIFNNVRKRSFAESNNDMAAIAKHGYLLLLNDDTVIAPNFLKDMVSTFTIDPLIAVVGCQLRYKHNNAIQHAGVFFNKDGLPYERRFNLTRHPDAERVCEVPSVTAACCMVRRDVWRQLNGLDEAFVNGWEDNDFLLRVREHGYKIWYNGKVNIFHVLHGSEKFGRLLKEDDNVKLYKRRWVDTGRVFKLVECI